MFLEINNIDSYYGLSHILFGVSLSVIEGESIFLLGRNGVGKTTTLSSIMGFVKPRAGSILFEGKELIGKEPHEIYRLGISIVPEGRRLFSGCTVRENLQIAKDFASNLRKGKQINDVLGIFPALTERMNQDAGTLSGGEQQMLALGRSIISDSKLVLLDEPTEGLAPLIKNALSEQILQMKKMGVSIVCADDKVELAQKMADRSYFIEKGQIKWSGTIEEMSKDDVLYQFLGISS